MCDLRCFGQWNCPYGDEDGRRADRTTGFGGIRELQVRSRAYDSIGVVDSGGVDVRKSSYQRASPTVYGLRETRFQHHTRRRARLVGVRGNVQRQL